MRRQETVLYARLQDAQKREDKQEIEIAQALKKNVLMEALLKKVGCLNPNPNTYTYSTFLLLFGNRGNEVQLLR